MLSLHLVARQGSKVILSQVIALEIDSSSFVKELHEASEAFRVQAGHINRRSSLANKVATKPFVTTARLVQYTNSILEGKQIHFTTY